MSDFDDLSQATAEVAAAVVSLSEAVNTIPPAIDKMEARITALLKQVISPAQLQQVKDAVAALRTTATAAADAAAKAAAAAADAADETDEATVLATSFPDRAAFDAGVAAYTGVAGVNLDGNTVKGGETPFLEYFTHSADGHIDTTGPTD